METVRFSAIEAKSVHYWILLGALAFGALIGYLAAHHMDVEGHHITGMNNQIVWGFPHVMAVFLIVAASGCTQCSVCFFRIWESGLQAPC